MSTIVIVLGFLCRSLPAVGFRISTLKSLCNGVVDQKKKKNSILGSEKEKDQQLDDLHL